MAIRQCNAAPNSPAYLEAHPAPVHPLELARHGGLLRLSLGTGRLVTWALKNEAGDEVVACVRPVMVLDDPEALAGAAASGMGIAMVPRPRALPLLEQGGLVCVLPGWHAETMPLAIYFSSRKLLPAKVRVFVDYIAEAFPPAGRRRAFGMSRLHAAPISWGWSASKRARPKARHPSTSSTGVAASLDLGHQIFAVVDSET